MKFTSTLAVVSFVSAAFVAAAPIPDPGTFEEVADAREYYEDDVFYSREYDDEMLEARELVDLIMEELYARSGGAKGAKEVFTKAGKETFDIAVQKVFDIANSRTNPNRPAPPFTVAAQPVTVGKPAPPGGPGPSRMPTIPPIKVPAKPAPAPAPAAPAPQAGSKKPVKPVHVPVKSVPRPGGHGNVKFPKRT